MKKSKGLINKLIKNQIRTNKNLWREFRLFSVECDHHGRIEDGYVSRCFCPNDGKNFNHGGSCDINRCPLFDSVIDYNINFRW